MGYPGSLRQCQHGPGIRLRRQGPRQQFRLAEGAGVQMFRERGLLCGLRTIPEHVFNVTARPRAYTRFRPSFLACLAHLLEKLPPMGWTAG